MITAPDNHGPGGGVGWLRAHATEGGLAGCAFLIAPDLVLTCAHVIGAHLGLPNPAPAEAPRALVTIRFEAIQQELPGRVVPEGWFANSSPPPGGLADIAVIRLDAPFPADWVVPAIATRLPTERRPALVHGAEAGYQSVGQQVACDLAGSHNARFLRQLDPPASPRGFVVGPGFSGSPVMDELGNVVWGMVVSAATTGGGVAYAIPADRLWAALRTAGLQFGPLAESAMARLRAAAAAAEAEARATSHADEAARLRSELADLRRMVTGLTREAEARPGAVAEASLASLAAGDPAPATALLRQRLAERLDSADAARSEAADLARQLGALLRPRDVASALAAYRQAAECDPSDPTLWLEIGGLEQKTGTLAAAAAAFAAARDASAATTPLRAAALHGLGDIHRAQGDLPAAGVSYRAALAIAERLAAADPANAQWQRDLSVSHTRLGDIDIAQGDLQAADASYRAALAIAERLAAVDPANAEGQRDLSISHNNLGDLHRAQGDLPAAGASYRAALAIRERLAAADPANAQWQRDLAISLGNLALAEPAPARALPLLHRGRDIIRRLAAQSPTDAALPADLAWFDAEIARRTP